MNNHNLTAAEEVLAAAANLTKNTQKEFTEWELTVETWRLNKNRWGLRGYQEKYPDHKRVMNEVMAKGTQKVTGRGWIERVRPNYYRLTSQGLARSASLSKVEIKPEVRNLYEYESVSPFALSSVFKNYCRDPSEPKNWLGAAAFLGLKGYDSNSLEKKLKSILDSIESALNWLDENNQDILVRDDNSEIITRERLVKLKEFIRVLEERFKTQFEAIRSPRK